MKSEILRRKLRASPGSGYVHPSSLPGEKILAEFLTTLSDADLESVFEFVDWSRYSLHMTRLCMVQFITRKSGPYKPVPRKKKKS